MESKIKNLRDSVSIIACYKLPKIHLNDKEWCSIVSNTKLKHRCIFLGDFNSHNEAWNCADMDSNDVSLLEQTEKLNLFLHNSNTHTRFNVATNYKSNIDLIFSTIDIAHLLMVKVSDDSRGSDHFPIHIEYDTEKTVYNKLSFKIQSQRTNWDQITKQLNDDYTKFLNCEYDAPNPLQKYDLLIETVKQTIVKRLRQAAYKKWEYTHNPSDLIEYKKRRAIAKKTFKDKKKNASINLLSLPI